MAKKTQTLLEMLTQPLTGDPWEYKISKTQEDNTPDEKTHTPWEVPQETIVHDNEEPVKNEEFAEGEKIYQDALAYIKDAIAPAMVKVSANDIMVNDTICKTLFTYAYPDFLEWNWLSPLINWDSKFDVSLFIYPTDAQKIMKYLRRRLTELKSEKFLNEERWLTSNPYTEAQIQDVEELRTLLTRWSEKYFHFSIYITLYAEDKEKLQKATNDLQNMLHGRNILTKTALLRAEQWLTATGPFCRDEVSVYRNISTRWLSTTFPFTSATLSQDDGVLYGINTHNNSLIIYDRFRTENANMVVLAKSWWGKSFAVKLEILRSLMIWHDVIVIDPENEYKTLVDTVWGTYLNVSINATQRINPFDLPLPFKDYDHHPGDLLRGAIINLIWLFKLMLWVMSPLEEAILEKAIVTTYSLKGITFENDDISGKEIPVMSDLFSVIETMEGALGLSQRIEKYVWWVFGGLFTKQTNVNLWGWLQVFSVRDLDEQLRPIAMYIILSYIWNVVRSSNRKRLLIIDEAWNIMQYEDSGKFLHGLVKRARKYHLWVTTITQDVEDFINNEHGKAIVTNSSLQLIMKQSPASIDAMQSVFRLTEQEKNILLNSPVWQGLFFAGTEHVGIQILASYFEEKVITTGL